MNVAKEVASWSKDPSKKIGCIAVKDRRTIATGFNGFPRGISDMQERLEDRDLKYRYVVHAEMNCIYNASYHGVSLDGSTFYIYGLPVCSECGKGIIQVGAKRVVWKAIADEIPTRWMDSNMLTEEMFIEAGVEYDRA
tara:strand:+ start:3792 stop:4205 length:414 start_codon:yes stop_codon:yes gene_type:complete